MREFDKLCKEFEKIDVLNYASMLAEKSSKVLPALEALHGNKESATEVFGTFIIAAIMSDGKLAEEEYALIYPTLHSFFGDDLDYETCKKRAKEKAKESEELKEVADEMVDIFGFLSDELKEDIIIICMLICAVDGKISQKEKKWIKQLIEE